MGAYVRLHFLLASTCAETAQSYILSCYNLIKDIHDDRMSSGAPEPPYYKLAFAVIKLCSSETIESEIVQIVDSFDQPQLCTHFFSHSLSIFFNQYISGGFFEAVLFFLSFLLHFILLFPHFLTSIFIANVKTPAYKSGRAEGALHTFTYSWTVRRGHQGARVKSTNSSGPTTRDGFEHRKHE